MVSSGRAHGGRGVAGAGSWGSRRRLRGRRRRVGGSAFQKRHVPPCGAPASPCVRRPKARWNPYKRHAVGHEPLPATWRVAWVPDRDRRSFRRRQMRCGKSGTAGRGGACPSSSVLSAARPHVLAVVVVELGLQASRSEPVDTVADREIDSLEVEIGRDPAADQGGDLRFDRRRERVPEPPFLPPGERSWVRRWPDRPDARRLAKIARLAAGTQLRRRFVAAPARSGER